MGKEHEIYIFFMAYSCGRSGGECRRGAVGFGPWAAVYSYAGHTAAQLARAVRGGLRERLMEGGRHMGRGRRAPGCPCPCYYCT